MILLIDDLRNFSDHRPALIARTSEEALEILKTGIALDEIWFDHDLGVVDGKIDDTMRVVDYLAEKAVFGRRVNVGIVYVHTSNPVGGNQIMKSLQNYGYVARRIQAYPTLYV